ncbi:MAG: response regulator transcription factor, partial [Verrucomicrobiae bacterium]|nr:response regulator transcription factor [Verrucomicrobiae bacterium]
RTLREDPAFTLTPFVFLTAKSAREDIRLGMNIGADDYLSKPVVHDELMSAVRARLNRSTSLHGAVHRGSQPDFERLDLLQSAFGLTHREAEVLAWLAQGKSNGAIGVLLEMSERTVKHHVSQCLGKMGCENRSSATLMAVEALSGRCPMSDGS